MSTKRTKIQNLARDEAENAVLDACFQKNDVLKVLIQGIHNGCLLFTFREVMETQKKTLETKKDSIQLLGPLDMSPVDWAGRFPRSRLTSIKVICKISGVFI